MCIQHNYYLYYSKNNIIIINITMNKIDNIDNINRYHIFFHKIFINCINNKFI